MGANWMKQIGKRMYKLFSGSRFSLHIIWKYERIMFVFLSAAALAGAVGGIISVLFPKVLLDGLADRDSSAVIISVVAFSICRGALFILESWGNQRSNLCSRRIQVFLETSLAEQLASLRYGQLEEPGNLKKYEFARNCVEKSNVESCVRAVFRILSALIVTGSVFYILRGLPWWILAVILSVVIVNVAGQMAAARYTYQEMEEETPTERELYYFRGRLMNQEYAKEIRSFQLIPYILDRTREAVEGFFRICRDYMKKHNKLLWWVYIASGIQSFLFYLYNGSLLWQGSITAGTFMMNVSALFQLSGSLNEMFSQFTSMEEQEMYLQGYREFLGLQSDYRGRGSVPAGEGPVIEFQDVSFRYPGQKTYALSHVSITIKPGEKIAVIGENGAGKSTFIKFLMGLYRPTEGRILVNGTDVEAIGHQEYLGLFASVMQDYQLYSFSILENILLGMEETQESRSRIWDLIRQLGLEEGMKQLPKDIDTFLTQRYDEGGVELSGGECQKLAIVRALYRNTPIVVLDEPTSALSPRSEYDLYSRFGQLTGGRTVLYISHRMSVCTLCDRVLVFSGGRIVEDGSHSGLYERNGVYAKTFREQEMLYGIKEG